MDAKVSPTLTKPVNILVIAAIVAGTIYVIVQYNNSKQKKDPNAKRILGL